MKPPELAAASLDELPIEIAANERQGSSGEESRDHVDPPNEAGRAEQGWTQLQSTAGCIEGRVELNPADRQVRAAAGIAMPGVRVVLDTGQAAWTDPHGWFSLTGVPFGIARLRVDPESLAGSERYWLPAQRVVRVSESNPYAFLTLRCRTAG